MIHDIFCEYTDNYNDPHICSCEWLAKIRQNQGERIAKKIKDINPKTHIGNFKFAENIISEAIAIARGQKEWS